MQSVARVALVLLVVTSGLVIGTTTDADAKVQTICPQGTDNGTVCVVEGAPPTTGAFICPVSSTVFLTGGECYMLVPRPAANCPSGTTSDPGGDLCRRPIAPLPGDLTCAIGYELVEGRCLQYIDPTCAAGDELIEGRCLENVDATCDPGGCGGRITVAYLVECFGPGIGRVVFGQPKLENGAQVSLVTVNGSAVVGAELAAGSAVSVVVTAERPTDEVLVSGPATVPSCGTSEPGAVAATPSATATSAPTPAPTPTRASEEPTATSAPIQAAEPTIPTPSPDAIDTPRATPTAETTSEPRTTPATEAAPATAPAVPPVQAAPPLAVTPLESESGTSAIKATLILGGVAIAALIGAGVTFMLTRDGRTQRF